MASSTSISFLGLLAALLWALPLHAATPQRIDAASVPPRVEAGLSEIRDDHPFYGLAFYYNQIGNFLLRDGELRSVHEPQVLEKNDYLVVTGRYRAMLIRAPGALVSAPEGTTHILPAAGMAEFWIGDKAELEEINDVPSLRYVHLWTPLAELSRAIERLLLLLHAWTQHWVGAIGLLSLLVKIVLLPLGRYTDAAQRKVSHYQSILAPQLAGIKAKYDGAAAHERIMAAHKALGITPFYTLRPLLGPLVQVPLLVAIFNTLGEMPQLKGISFAWIDNLAYPDSIGNLPFVIPLLGDQIRLLPFMMTAVTVATAMLYRNPHAPAAQARAQRRNLYFMALGFFILFYPFPAAMVLYWALANVLQLLYQQWVQR